MKYIDAELLKTELKRRIKERDNMMKLGTYFSTSYVYEDILDLIDSLQQEQPEGELEKEMTAYIEQHFHIRYDETLEVGNDPLTTYDFEKIARHFYELGKNSK